MSEIPTNSFWPHAPPHRLSENGTFLITAGTYNKQHFFASSNRLDALCAGLMKYAKKYQWELQAWAVFPNHYHFVAQAPCDGSKSLSKFLSHFHSRSAAWINGLDQTPDRKVWHNFWDTRLTYERSYFARLNYVHQNAVKHGLVPVANQYKWCSASWFEAKSKPSMVNTIYSFKTDRIHMKDDF